MFCKKGISNADVMQLKRQVRKVIEERDRNIIDGYGTAQHFTDLSAGSGNQFFFMGAYIDAEYDGTDNQQGNDNGCNAQEIFEVFIQIIGLSLKL